MYEYKVLNGSIVVQKKKDFAQTLEELLNSMERDGWEFYSQSDIDQLVPPGCLLSLLGKKSEIITHQTFVFRKLKK